MRTFSSRFPVREEKHFRIDNFNGANFTSAQFASGYYRATEISNFIKKDGVIKNREGWKEIHQFDTNEVVHDMWNCHSRYGKYIVAHVGNKLFLVNEETEIISTILEEVNGKAFGLLRDNIFYFICNGFYTYDFETQTISRLDGTTNVFIPTTSISIKTSDSVLDKYAVTFEGVNLLTPWRKNKLLSVESDNSIYTLDGRMTGFENDLLEYGYIEIKYMEDGIEKEHKINFSSAEFVEDDDNYLIKARISLQGVINDLTLSTPKDKGNTTLTLSKGLKPLIAGQDNITVMYKAEVGYDTSPIIKCKFGIMYGYGGHKDRLFLSGNEDFPNRDWRSGDDLTYFPDLNYTNFGTINNAVVGYGILATGDMVVLKGDSALEPTAYFRTYTLTPALDETGKVIVDNVGNVLYQEQYSVKLGSINTGAISSEVISLNGDLLMLAKSGVYGIVIGENIPSEARYARCRSILINPKLTAHDLSKAKTIVHDNKYYVCIDGKCYVANGQERFELDNELQYEWYVFDNIHATCFLVRNGQLLFGSETGQICSFENSVNDVSYLKIPQGNITYDYEAKRFVINAELVTKTEPLLDGNTIKIETINTVHARLYNKKDFFTIDQGKVMLKKNIGSEIGILLTPSVIRIGFIDDNMEYTIGLGRYYISDVNTEEKSFILYDIVTDRPAMFSSSVEDILVVVDQNDIISITETQNEDGILLKNCVKIDGHYYMRDEKGNIIERLPEKKAIFNYFKVSLIGKTLDITSTIVNVSGLMTVSVPVKCYYVTETFDMGTTVYLKQLKKLILTPNNRLGTSVAFGYEVLNAEDSFIAKGVAGLDFNNLDFDNINFGSDEFSKSYIKDRLRRKFNHIRFIFRSIDSFGCDISNITMVFTIVKQNKGDV